MAKTALAQKPAPLSIAIVDSDIPIASLRRDAELTCRVKGTSPRVVAEYADAMRAGMTFPPVVAFKDPEGTLWLADGFHRVAAVESTGAAFILADVRDGTRADALVHAAGANAAHGFRRTTADKRRAVALLLAAFPEWSDRRLAETAQVSDKTVTASRTAEFPQLPRTGKDGKARKPPKARRGRPKAPPIVRALRPFAVQLERLAKSRPEALADIERVNLAIAALIAKLSPVGGAS